MILLLGAFAACGNTSSATPPADDENAEAKDTTNGKGPEAEKETNENIGNKEPIEAPKTTTIR